MQHSRRCYISAWVQPHAELDQRVHALKRAKTHGQTNHESTKWKTFSKQWHRYMQVSATASMNAPHLSAVFANCSKEDDIYPLTTFEIAEAQRADASIKHLFKRNAVFDQGSEVKLIENILCVCKDGRLVIPKPLQRQAVMWHHHYLQHPGHTHLKETMNAAMYWKDMCSTIRSVTRSCKTCQTNKRRTLKYGHLPPKSVISNPWECLCVDLIGPYTLKAEMTRRSTSWLLPWLTPLPAGLRLRNYR